MDRETIDPDEHPHMDRHYHGTEEVITIDKRTGWYFARSEFGWERHGPYDAVSVGLIMRAFEQDTGMEGEVGDRVYMDGQLKELTAGKPPQVVATGARAEDVMQEMLRAPGK
jgi:hypothetical protein